jgi:hypothetical protein
MDRQKKTLLRKVLDAALVVLILTVALPLALITISLALTYRGALYLLVSLRLLVK